MAHTALAHWQGLPGIGNTLALGQAESFSYPAGRRGKEPSGCIELASRDCFVRWVVTTTNNLQFRKVEVLETGPASLVCFDVPAEADVVIVPHVLARQQDMTLTNLRCAISADGLQRRQVTIVPAVPAAGGVELLIGALVTPEPAISSRFYPGASAVDLRQHDSEQRFGWLNLTEGVILNTGEPGTVNQYPAAAVITGMNGDVPLIYPAGYRRLFEPPYNPSGVILPGGSSMSLRQFTLIETAGALNMGEITNGATFPADTAIVGAFDAIGIELIDTVPGDELPAFAFAYQQYSRVP